MIQVIDLSALVPAELVNAPDFLAMVIPDIAEAARTEIIRLAQERLGSTGEDYIQNVSPVAYHLPKGKLPMGDALAATIVLSGWLPNSVENGWPGGDMKVWLLAGRNAKTGKTGGRYNTVPFRHGTPGVTGANFPEMGSAYATSFRVNKLSLEQVGSLTREEASRLGKKIHSAAMELKPTISHPKTGTKWGGRLDAGTGGAGLLRPHHKTDIYAGMVREQKTYRKATQSKYSTFRRVSDKSDASAWIHPGIEGVHLFEAGAEYIDKAARFLFGKALEGAFAGARS
jgi:hypothetical protein